jgi:hypothetical protein
VRLRNGDVLFIAQDIAELAVVNLNLYLFPAQNLYYYNNATGVALFLTYLVPGHTPLGVAWQYVHAAGGIEVDGEGVLVYTATCVLRLWIKAPDFWVNPRISITAGHCYEITFARDGLPTFARFTQIQQVTSGCEAADRRAPDCALLLLDSSGHRLSLLQGGQVRSAYLDRAILAISLWGTSTVAISWLGATTGGFSLAAFASLLDPHMQPPRLTTWGTGQEWLALSILDETHVFAISRHGTLVRFAGPSTFTLLGVTPFEPTPGHTPLALDFPYGLFVLDVARQAFYLAPNLGCLCPPGFASLAQIENQHCQPAPAGGYVDVLGRFVACPPGTMGTLNLATVQQTCAPCPPATISNQSQSTRCAVCLPGTVPDPLRTTCVPTCPEGTQPLASGCRPCATRGQTFHSPSGRCVPCPENTYSDPDQGLYTCAPCPGPSPPCPLPCGQNNSESTTVTIAMLGVRPVDMAVSQRNGTVYIAAFQVLITVGHSGNALEVILPEFALVRGIALGPNEAVLYAAVTQASLLCIAFADTPRLLRRWYWPSPVGPSAVLVGVRLSQTVTVVWDAASNRLRAVPSLLIVDPPAESEIMAFTVSASSGDILIMYRNTSSLSLAQPQQTLMTHKGVLLARNTDPATAWNPHLAVWQGQLMLSSVNAIVQPSSGQVWGLRNTSGRVDASRPSDARFTSPGPMAEAPNAHMLLMVDQIGLHVLFRSACASACPEAYYHYHYPSTNNDECRPCPEGWVSMLGSNACTACTQGQFTHPTRGKCVPCPRIRWWTESLPCSHIVDTMVGAEASGLTLSDMVGELLTGNPLGIMQQKDYVSLQTLVLPAPVDTVLLDAAANARFWTRAQRVTPPPEVFVSGEMLDLHLELELPGFWVACSDYVLEIETCDCQLPAGGILLGNGDMTSLWNKARAKAAAIDFSTLLVTLPPDPDLFLAMGGIEEAVHFRESFNISTASALFVARTDAGGGTDDDNPNVLFFEAVDADMSISVQPTPAPTPSQSAFATCVAGWPATYSCPAGFLWVPPLFTCVPCKPGFAFANGRCVPCPQGTFSPLPGSTTCTACVTARASGQSACNISNSTELPTANNNNKGCPAGSETRNVVGQCLPCLPGYSKAAEGTAYCMPCPPGQYANALGRTACTPCFFPLVATQWGSSACMPCAQGSIPSAKADTCLLCQARVQYFALLRGTNTPVCVNKTVLQCKAGFYLNDGGVLADNQCQPCAPCPQGTLMVPFLLSPCQTPTATLGSPYRCVPLRSVAGQFSRLSLNKLNSSAFDVQYTPCQGLPPYASWTEGPSPAYCFFQCNYAVAGPVRRQYLFYYTMEKQDAQTQNMLQQLFLPNVYPLDYPGLAVDLMLLANRVCLPCPNTPCPLGTWRPVLAEGGCGPPTCTPSACQSMETGAPRYDADGCVMPCSLPANAHITGVAPLGMGDACPWQCDVGFYMELVMVDLDENRTGFICLPCSPTVCKQGMEEYHVADCLPTSQRADFCIQCPSSFLAIPVLLSSSIEASSITAGKCQYACQPNVSFQSSIDHQCKPCPTNVVCPAGHRVVCAEQPCVQCPSLPMTLWSSALTMPSSTAQCQAACRDGFHTLDAVTRAVLLPPAFSYDPSTILCAPCAQRPSLPCPARACPTGYFMPVPGSGLCTRCPTDYDCGLGKFPSSCICTQCPTPPFNYMPILATQASTLLRLYGTNYSVSIRCPMVCTWNTMSVTPSSPCVACNTFDAQPQQQGLSFYSVWNASNGTRWWPSSQDPPHLPPRPPDGGPERRAGLCWPCPPGTLTLPGDADLCLSPTSVSITNQIASSDGGGGGMVFVLSAQPLIPMTRRKLLENGQPPSTSSGRRSRRRKKQPAHPPTATAFAHTPLCPAFASGVYPHCHCNPGFIFMPTTGTCAFEQRCSPQHRLALTSHGATATLRLVNHPHLPCRPHEVRDAHHGHCLSPPRRQGVLPENSRGCAPGYYYTEEVEAVCQPCPRGYYSPHHGLGPCLACPYGMTTTLEQSVLRIQCLVPLAGDIPFSLVYGK